MNRLKTVLLRTQLLLLTIVSILLVISSTLLVYSYSTKSLDIVKYNYEYAYLKTMINTLLIVKPSMIYDYRTTIASNETYLSLARRILINASICYNISNNTDLGEPVVINTRYNIYSVIETEHWSKEFRINTSFVDKTYYIDIDIDYLLNIINTIDSEIKTRSHSVRNNIFINTALFVKYSSGIIREYVLNPVIKVEIDNNSNKLKISSNNVERVYGEERAVEKAVIIKSLNTSVVSLRKYTLYSTMVLTTLLMPLLVINLKKSFEKNSYLEKIIESSIRGKLVNYGNKTIVNTNYRVLFSLSKIHGIKPIYDSSEKKLYLVLRDIVYTSSVD